MKRLLIASAALAVSAAFIAGPASAQKTYVMKIGFPTINDSNHLAAKWLEKEIEKKSAGRIDVKVFPAGQLGKIPRQIEGIQTGVQEALQIPPGFFVGVNRGFMVPDSPGLFDSVQHQFRALNHPPFRDKFLMQGASKGFIGTMVWSCGDTSIATLKPFKTLEDIKGRKIRVLATPLERAVMEKLGAIGVPMPYTEVLPAMQRKVIDGVRSGIIVMYPSKFYTVAKHITLTGMGFIACGQWLSKAWLKSLPDDLRGIVYQAAKDATPHAGKWGEDMTRAAERDWGKVAVVHRLSAADTAEFRRRVAPIGDDILGKDPRTKGMYNLLKAAVAATRK